MIRTNQQLKFKNNMNTIYHSARNSILYTLQHKELDNFFLLIENINELMDIDLKDYPTKSKIIDERFKNIDSITPEEAKNLPVVEINITPEEIDSFYLETFREAFRLASKYNIDVKTILIYFEKLNYFSDKEKLFVYLERVNQTSDLMSEIIAIWEKNIFIEQEEFKQLLTQKLSAYKVTADEIKLDESLIQLMEEQQTFKNYLNLNNQLDKINNEVIQRKI